MRATAMILLLCMSFDSAGAQTAEQCLVQRAGDLLDCYNGATPPPRPVKRKTSKASTAPYKPVSQAPIAVDKPAAAPKTPTDQKAQYVDELAVENSKLDAKMKTICRGC
jgi:hypothetical protein